MLNPVYEWRFYISGGLKSIWRFTNMFPRFENTITLDEGNTPLLEPTRVFKNMNVYFKDEG
ncbi:hypothetical protein Tagg_0351 [Thermosphaera aggregans DSM 11486]|uniref:Uncharacterized protein n=1 Tax=Thermosphaera aggregans (strain DSM 11486 / M11TL) TaxID=633148 RepID=D5U0H6_THEAM|nr:hypothetical protein Tagg_0351 [Thermosphaera aggregans DSM 11486]